MRALLVRSLIVGCLAAGCGRVGAAPPASAEGPPPVPLLQPGPPGQTSRPISVAEATDLSKVQFKSADARFMSGMIGHHAQAVEMVALLEARTASDTMRMLGKRIEVSQIDEMQMMREWLGTRGLPAPDPHAHHMDGASLMPGMLTPEEMARLAAAQGRTFDQLFLEGMIKHHRGALTMVEELFASPGAAQDSEIYSFASDVDADQRMEIDRMGAMLQEMSK
jgi:uncharacterized protein (DUF305 family)